MNAPRPPTADDVIRALVDHAPMKVWSYLVTVFGDLAGGPGEEIGGATLRALTERVGIRPEAMRVALHRLRKDDWIVARRSGRNGLYRLGDRGLAETRRASRRIYARGVEGPDLWHLLIADPASPAPAPPAHGDYLRIAGGVLLGAGPCPPDAGDALAVEFARLAVPAWVLRGAVPEENMESQSRTAALLTWTGEALGALDAAPALDRTTVRLLAIHHWRRAVLRHPPLVEMLPGGDPAGAAACRAAIATILDRLPRPPRTT